MILTIDPTGAVLADTITISSIKFGRLKARRSHKEIKTEAELRQLGVEHPYLFGSTARGEAREDSDVALFFDYERGKRRQCGCLRYATPRRTALITVGSTGRRRQRRRQSEAKPGLDLCISAVGPIPRLRA